jgi:hypothetical protein
MKLLTLVQNVAKLTDAVEINEIVKAIKVAQKRMDRMAADKFSVGMNVMVVQKTKSTPGVIVKVNRSRSIVKMHGSRYNVPNSMISTGIDRF